MVLVYREKQRDFLKMNPWIALLATLGLVYRAISRNSLTPIGIVAAVLTAGAHAIHPWSVFFTLLVVFFLAGTAVTKVKHDIKAKLTHSSSGSPGGEGPRGHIQVLANSIVASVLILLHAWVLRQNEKKGSCLPRKGLQIEDVLVFGIIGNYAAVASDTFSSELGILSKSNPRLITAPWRVVPPGTNGGVSATGLQAGLLGSFLISTVAVVMMPLCAGWTLQSKVNLVVGLTAVGLGGSLLDSLLGAALQASVVDVRTGKVIEGDGGYKVLVAASTPTKDTKGSQSRKIAVGHDILDNNAVNLLMAGSMSLVAMVGAAWALVE
ncbi:hypothetical protein BT63DRAFT_456593 [Microthyrium microscopicum]|uniref:DUF92-domain-containing protein n=1 Tax=Microthyrium microscopicum TaxID=703497 RepID=A0A6A6U6S4_9PEZI|nr:hypothetical protein BT63DRAFT_456593 [Microthyrium microscopicum]